jgi:hypothetical protein
MRLSKLPLGLAGLALLLLTSGCTHSNPGHSTEESAPAANPAPPFEKTNRLAKQSQIDSTRIIGTWLSGSGHWRLVVSPDYICRQYMDDTLVETDSVVISNTSPQCGIKVPVSMYTSYLRLTNVADTTQNLCYQLNNFTDSSMSITPVGHGGILTFKRLK